MNFCPNCNKSYSDEITFCLADGTVLVAHSQEQETVFIPPPKPASLTQTTSIRKSFYISFGIGLAALILGAIAMSLVNSFWKTENNPNAFRSEKAPKVENSTTPEQPPVAGRESVPKIENTVTPDRSTVKNDVRAALDGWVQTLRDHDLEKHLSYYANQLEVHRGSKNVDISHIRRFNEKLFNRYSQFDLQIFDVTANVTDDGQVVTTYKSSYDFRGSKKRHSGTDSRTEMRWKSINGVWKIVSER